MIQACILQKLKAEIVRTLGEVDRVVITVPAYFDEPRRKRTCDAGEMAGLKVLDIVNEPTAAALAFGEMLGYLTADDAPKDAMTILVYDLGGGTFDVTLLRLAPGHIQTIATDGDVQLGGHDWDMRLVEFVADRFKRLHKRDPRENRAVMNRILAAAIDAKHALQRRSRTTIRAEWAGQAIEVPVTREQFEELTADLLERTRYTTRQLLAAAKMEWKDVDAAAVGGRIDADADGRRHVAEAQRQGARPHGQSRRGGCPRRRPLCRISAGEGEGQRRPCGPRHHERQLPQPRRGRDRSRDVAQEELHSHSAQYAAAGKAHGAVRHERAEPAIDRDSGSEGESTQPSECTAIGRTVIRDLPEGLAEELAHRSHLRVCRQRPPDRERDGAGHAPRRELELERAAGMSGEGIARWKRPIGAAAGFDEFESLVEEVLALSMDGSEHGADDAGRRRAETG